MSSVLLLGAVVALILVNGMFVAAEFALVTVPRPAIEERAAAGGRRARAVLAELTDLSFALSVAQFGITVSSLVVGYIADRAVGDVLIRPVLALIGIPEQTSLAISVTAALLLSTLVQVVVGELVPKNVAMTSPIGVSLALTPATRAFGWLFRPIIILFDASAAAVARRLFRIEIADELERGRTLDELARIVMASGAQGSLSEVQTQLLGRAMELGETRVVEVMIPRPDVVTLTDTDTLEDLRRVSRDSGHSRFPVRVDGSDDFVGTVHVKDLLAVPAEDCASTTVGEVAVDVLSVPGAARLPKLLTLLRREQRTFALVVDEHGTTAGIVTVEDLVERVVGDISDEFDRRARVVRRAGPRRFLVSGAMRVDQLVRQVGVELPEGPYETIAGHVLDALGHIPEVGESVTTDTATITVTATSGARITEVAVQLAGGDE
ncbi:MAG: hemolysin family protein [Nitriliruptoraceae bacterium]